MKYRNFGSIKEKVSEIGFGAAAISGKGGGYGFGDVKEEDAISMVEFCYNSGINLFDTAPIYGFRESEKRLGKALKAFREKVLLVSKSGVTWHGNMRVDMNNDPLIAEKMLHQSLKDLQTDYIDLYMVHWPDQRWDIRKTLEVYAKALEQQKIRYVGLCNTTEEELELAREVVPISAVQSQMNYFEHSVVGKLFSYLRTHRIGFMSWGTLDKGILTGRVNKKREYDQYDCRKNAPWWDKKEVQKKVAFCEEKLFPVLETFAVTPLQFALAFNLRHLEVSTVLCGGKSHKQWEELLHSHEKLPSLETFDAILKQVGSVQN